MEPELIEAAGLTEIEGHWCEMPKTASRSDLFRAGYADVTRLLAHIKALDLLIDEMKKDVILERTANADRGHFLTRDAWLALVDENESLKIENDRLREELDSWAPTTC